MSRNQHSRRFRLIVLMERLEDRRLLSGGTNPGSSTSSRPILQSIVAKPGYVLAHAPVAGPTGVARTTFEARPLDPGGEAHPLAGGGGPSPPYTPAELQQAYGFNSVTFNGVAGTGSGETIAIVDAYDDPNIQADLNTFDTQFGLSSTTVTRVNQTGGTSYPTADATGGWELEESLDVEWAHAMAPGANLLLVEANSANETDLLAAVDYAAADANVVSMSWGGSEFSGETSYDSHFSRAGVAFVASSGDNGAPASWPAASPNVLSVGGTALTLGAGNVWSSEVGWSGSGGGPSAYEAQPSYQTGVVTQTATARATPDVAYNASGSTGVYVYDSVAYGGSSGWWSVGGTSAGAPQWSALLAIADQGRTLSGQAALNSTSPQQVMNVLYQRPADFHDITTGTSTGTPPYSAGPGYDYVTGMGSPIANLLIPDLAPSGLVQLAPIADQAVTAGQSLTLTLQGSDPNGLPLTYSASEDTLAYHLKSTLGLYTAGNYYTNWGGRNEKWIQGTGGVWYFITPDGGFYQWDGSGTASGSLVAQLDPNFNADPTLLTNAQDETLAYHFRRTLGLYTSGNYYTNWGGRNEKWIQGTGGVWYFITPDGSLYQWDGSGTASGSLVAQFSPAYNADPTLLTNAPQYPATLAVSGASLTITPQSGFTGAFYVTATVSNGQLSASQAFKVTVTS
jgi:hypothetical protein